MSTYIVSPYKAQTTPAVGPYGSRTDAGATHIQSKFSRGHPAQPVLVNAQGMCQGPFSTSGMTFIGGPIFQTAGYRLIDTASNTATLTAADIVDGIIVVAQGAACTLTLPTVTELNNFIERSFVSAGTALAVATAYAGPRTRFTLRIFCNGAITFGSQNIAQPGHAGSGYSFQIIPAAASNVSIATLAVNATRAGIIPAVPAGATRAAIDLIFVQTAGTGADPEWLIVGANA